MSSLKPLVVLGDGTFAIETLEVAEAAGGWNPVGFLNSLAPQNPDRRHAGLPVFGIDDLPFGPDDGMLVAGIVSTKRRSLIQTLEARGYRFATLVHPSAVVSPRSSLGPGAVALPQVVVGANTTVGPHTILNRGALVGHDNTLGAFSTIGPGANLAGNVTVGEGAYVGVGAVVRERVTIGEGAVVGAGAVVIRDVESRVLVAGVPATIMRRDVDGL